MDAYYLSGLCRNFGHVWQENNRCMYCGISKDSTAIPATIPSYYMAHAGSGLQTLVTDHAIENNKENKP